MRASWVTRFSFKFYVIFILISLLGSLFFNYKELELFTLFLVVLYVLQFLVGTRLGSTWKPKKILNLQVDSDVLLKFLLVFCTISVLLGWFYIIKNYGSIATIFASSLAFRQETIGDGVQLVPVYISYSACFVYVGLVVSLSRFHYYGQRKDIVRALYFGVLIVLLDFQSFGRIGMLYSIFIIIGYVLLFKVAISIKKIIIPGIAALSIFMLPRWFRGGNSLEGMSDEYADALKVSIPGLFSPFLAIYAYYFSGIYALNEYLKKTNIVFYEGKRNFSSLINLYNRLFSLEDTSHRLIIQGDNVQIPYDTNIFTIIGECYMDFGIFGVFILPLFFGFCIGLLFKYEGLYADALKLIMIGWIFYTPIYNAFSFGGFLFPFMFLIFLTCTVKNEKNMLVKKCKHLEK